MKHIDCMQNERIDKIDSRLKTQKQLGEETFAKVEEVSKSLEDISTSIKGLVELNTEVNDMKTAWRVAKRLGLGMALFIGTMSIITGGIYAVKEWIKK